jgi:Spy/CpxP family protein refolding chaperone
LRGQSAFAAFTAIVAVTVGAFAQPPAQSPYAGLQARPIKALSAEQMADLKAGRGMGLALPAELNGYPGPRHLLDLADQLGLSSRQRDALQSMFDTMKAEAIPLGERLIEQETALDGLFSRRQATAETVAAATAAIGETQAKLRNAHLKYHLATVALLQPDQIERYQKLRGYGDASPPGQHRHH